MARETTRNAASTSGRDSQPEERLESWRFLVAEGETEAAHDTGLLRWMQEVEAQLANLRGRLNELPSEYVRRVIVW